MKRGKNYKATVETLKKNHVYTLDEALPLVKAGAKAKFVESVELHVRLNIDPKKGDQAIRGVVTLPHGTGKTTRVAVVTEKDAQEAKAAGADVVGGQELIDQIKAGKLPDVDVIVTSPDMMPKLAQAARILGPRGMMPSPKTDTVTTNIAQAVEELKKGKESFKNDNSANVHQVIGKTSFDEDKLKANAQVFLKAVADQKNDAHKGNLIRSISICSTMGPGMKIKA